MLILSKNIDKMIKRNSVFDCHLSHKWQSKILFLRIFDQRSLIVLSFFDCCLPGVTKEQLESGILYPPSTICKP